MTLGERITALRKEKGLSQEALGEAVGVTRQAVSKWESDKALPDVSNCVAMSRVFGVTLARLLDLEETPAAPVTTELNEQQMKLVDQMVQRYADAQRRLRRRWRWPLILLLCAMFVGGAWLWEWLTAMNRTIEYMSGEMAGMQGGIVSGIGEQVQQSLEAESSLVTAYSAELVRADVLEETVTFRICVTLKTGGADTVVSFVSRGTGEVAVIPAEHQGGLDYCGQVTCPIMDDPPVDLLVEEAGVTRSQRFFMESYASDYAIDLSTHVRWAALSGSGLTDGAIEPVKIHISLSPNKGLTERLRLTALEIGIFRNDVLAHTIVLDPDQGHFGVMDDWYFHQEIDIPVPADIARAGDTLTFALLAEDNYGRRKSALISRYQVLEDGKVESLANDVLRMDEGTYGTEGWR